MAGELRVYLQDHHAAAGAGLALARRTFGAGHPLSLRIAQDRTTLEDVMRALDVPPSRTKLALARVGDQLGRLKTDRAVASHPPLGRLLALETLLVGVRGKQALWRALQIAPDPRLARFDFAALAQSADDQCDALERYRLRAAAEAFGGALGEAELAA